VGNVIPFPLPLFSFISLSTSVLSILLLPIPFIFPSYHCSHLSILPLLHVKTVPSPLFFHFSIHLSTSLLYPLFLPPPFHLPIPSSSFPRILVTERWVLPKRKIKWLLFTFRCFDCSFGTIKEQIFHPKYFVSILVPTFRDGC
jgi:hypothetical protein